MSTLPGAVVARNRRSIMTSAAPKFAVLSLCVAAAVFAVQRFSGGESHSLNDCNALQDWLPSGVVPPNSFSRVPCQGSPMDAKLSALHCPS